MSAISELDSLLTNQLDGGAANASKGLIRSLLLEFFQAGYWLALEDAVAAKRYRTGLHRESHPVGSINGFERYLRRQEQP